MICGSRGWKDPRPIEAIIAGYSMLADGAGEQLYVVHGNARKGADKIADRIARQWGATPIPVDPDWKRYGKGAGPKRNERMLAEHPDIKAVYAFRTYGKSSGTDDMVEQAEDAKIPTFVVNGGEHPTEPTQEYLA